MRTPGTIAALLLLALVPAAAADEPAPTSARCGPADEMLQIAADRFHEKPVWAGTIDGEDAGGALITAAPSGSWTLFALRPNGTLCAFIWGAGSHFAKAPERGAAAQ